MSRTIPSNPAQVELGFTHVNSYMGGTSGDTICSFEEAGFHLWDLMPKRANKRIDAHYVLMQTNGLLVDRLSGSYFPHQMPMIESHIEIAQGLGLPVFELDFDSHYPVPAQSVGNMAVAQTVGVSNIYLIRPEATTMYQQIRNILGV